MKQAAIAIDNWKLPIFSRHLKQAGYNYTVVEGLTKDAMVLTVYTDNVQAIAVVVTAANKEAAQTKGN